MPRRGISDQTVAMLTEENRRQNIPLWQVMENLAPLLLPPGATRAKDVNFRRRIEQRWLTEVAPLLGNTITEEVQASPTRLTFVRKSHLGLTGIELIFIARALSGATPSPVTAPLLSAPAKN